MADRYLRQPEMLARVGLSRTTVWKLEKQGAFPKRRAIVGRTVAWLESEIAEWQASRPTLSHNGGEE